MDTEPRASEPEKIEPIAQHAHRHRRHVSRHFFTKQEVKDFIDQMVRYKFNLFHWHLTDDEGWRIEIKGLPKLTEIGAWNVKKVGYFGTFSLPTPDEPRDYGGFYTQADITEVVQYAKERFVNIMPEVDVPGHSLAAITAYPDLSCSNGVSWAWTGPAAFSSSLQIPSLAAGRLTR